MGYEEVLASVGTYELQWTGCNRYYVPAELDIFISFAPVKNRPERGMLSSFAGSIKIEAKFIKDIELVRNGAGKMVIYWRLGSPDSNAEKVREEPPTGVDSLLAMFERDSKYFAYACGVVALIPSVAIFVICLF